MNDAVLTKPRDATPAWVTRVLRAADQLTHGEVTAVAAAAADGTWSQCGRLRLTYSDAATGPCPPTVFLKICAGAHAVFGPSEVQYYTRDYVAHPHAPLPRCFHAAYEEAPRRYHLLLEDLSDSHTNAWDVVWTEALLAQAVSSLATLHAVYWRTRSLPEMSPAWNTGADRYFTHVQRGHEPLLQSVRAPLDPDWRHALETVIELGPAVWRARLRDVSGLTLVHGDPNPGNVLYPRDGNGPVLLIDRQPFDWSPVVWLAASDLAILMVTYLTRAERRAMEAPVLAHYQRSLVAAGVDYSLDAVYADYRLALTQCVGGAVEWCGVPEDIEPKRWIWESQLRRSMDAFLAHDVEALLRGE